MRRPDGKIDAGNSLHGHGMGSQFLIDIIADPRPEAFQLLLRDLRLKIVGILPAGRISTVKGHLQCIRRNPFSRNQGRKKARLILQFHWVRFLSAYNTDGCCRGNKCLNQDALIRDLCSQKTVRVIGLRISDCLDLCPVHQVIQSFVHPNTPPLVSFILRGTSAPPLS